MPPSRKGKKQKALHESDAIELLARELSARGPGIELGIGDDAALLRRVSGKLVLSVDTNLEHTHFELDWLRLDQLGARALHSAASDLAAMGARPVAALSALVLPPGVRESDLKRLARGQAQAAEELGCVVVGGNLTRGREWSLTTTVIGSSETALSRRGAARGDAVWLVGDVGLAAAGLRLLQAGRGRARGRAAARCLRAWREPRALVKQGLALVGRASAAIDISDGLGRDAGHLARASNRRVVIEQAALEAALAPELGLVAHELGVDPLELALAGGEDYALLATGNPRKRPRFARVIGRVEAGAGVVLESKSGQQPLMGGFDHFSAG